MGPPKIFGAGLPKICPCSQEPALGVIEKLPSSCPVYGPRLAPPSDENVTVAFAGPHTNPQRTNAKPDLKVVVINGPFTEFAPVSNGNITEQMRPAGSTPDPLRIAGVSGEEHAKIALFSRSPFQRNPVLQIDHRSQQNKKQNVSVSTAAIPHNKSLVVNRTSLPRQNTSILTVQVSLIHAYPNSLACHVQHFARKKLNSSGSIDSFALVKFDGSCHGLSETGHRTHSISLPASRAGRRKLSVTLANGFSMLFTSSVTLFLLQLLAAVNRFPCAISVLASGRANGRPRGCDASSARG